MTKFVSMKLSTVRASAIFSLLAFSSLADAAPRTIDDCEKIEAAHLYNLCLAQFGPRAGGSRHGSGSSAGVPQGPPPAGARGAKRHAGPQQRLPAKGGLVLRQTRDGRVVAEFSLGAPKAQPTRRKGEGR